MRNTQFARGSIGSTSAARTASTITNTSVNGAARTVLTISFSWRAHAPHGHRADEAVHDEPGAAGRDRDEHALMQRAARERQAREHADRRERRSARPPDELPARRRDPDASGCIITRSNRR